MQTKIKTKKAHTYEYKKKPHTHTNTKAKHINAKKNNIKTKQNIRIKEMTESSLIFTFLL